MCGGNPVRRHLRTAQQVSSPQDETISRVSAAAQMTCSVCHTPVQADFTWCPACGGALKSQPCAYCGHMLAPEEKNCSACGAPRQRVRTGQAEPSYSGGIK